MKSSGTMWRVPFSEPGQTSLKFLIGEGVMQQSFAIMLTCKSTVAMLENLAVPGILMEQGLYYLLQTSTNLKWFKRSFEYLGATSSTSTTHVPGGSSFTSALIWALKELVNEKGRFTVSDLSRKITDAPGFPEDQFPILRERSEPSLERIMLAPLHHNVENGDDARIPSKPQNEAPTRGILSLNFVFKHPPSKEEVKKFAENLKRFWLNHDLPLDRIVWGGLSRWEGGSAHSVGPGFFRAVNVFKSIHRRLPKASHEENSSDLPKSRSQPWKSPTDSEFDPSKSTELNQNRQALDERNRNTGRWMLLGSAFVALFWYRCCRSISR